MGAVWHALIAVALMQAQKKAQSAGEASSTEQPDAASAGAAQPSTPAPQPACLEPSSAAAAVSEPAPAAGLQPSMPAASGQPDAPPDQGFQPVQRRRSKQQGRHDASAQAVAQPERSFANAGVRHVPEHPAGLSLLINKRFPVLQGWWRASCKSGQQPAALQMSKHESALQPICSAACADCWHACRRQAHQPQSVLCAWRGSARSSCCPVATCACVRAVHHRSAAQRTSLQSARSAARWWLPR